MEARSKKRGGSLTFEQAEAIWNSIKDQQNCEECGHETIELQSAGIFQKSPQRPDPQGEYDETTLLYCLGCQYLFGKFDLDQQAEIRHIIRAAPTPLPLVADPLVHPVNVQSLPNHRQTHHQRFNKNGIIFPPENVKKAIDDFYYNNISTPNYRHKNKKVKKLPGASKQELYRLWWLSGDFCNLSGADGDWDENSITKLTFDRIIPEASGGTYDLYNLQIVLICVNKAKRDYSNEEGKVWMRGYKNN